jgi:hypothetical protein
MSPVPTPVRVYHITHVDNLATIAHGGGLVSDAEIMRRGGPPAAIGMSGIKRRRLQLPVRCHPGAFVGDFVPFYFCPRSIMLYVIHRANHEDLTYRGGQGPIVHLEADLPTVVRWAEENDRRWAISLSNAGAYYAEFRSGVDHLSELNWTAIAASDFRDADIKEGKQAEFLLHTEFPWLLVSRIGVRSAELKAKVERAIAASSHRPFVEVRPDWYY